MKPSSCKAKGRTFQQAIVAKLLAVGSKYGLVDDDVKSTSMGVSGVDVQLSPAAKRVFGPLASECKCVEKLNVVGVFTKHRAKYHPDHIVLLFHKKNRTQPMVTLDLDTFIDFYSAWLEKRNQ